MQLSKINQFNIFYLVTSIIWPLLKYNYLGRIDGYGRIEMMLMITAILVNRKYLFKIPKNIWLWGIWIVYVVICSTQKGFYDDNLTFLHWTILKLIYPFITMIVAYRAIMDSSEKTLKYIFFFYLFYVILGSLSLGRTIDSQRITNEMGNDFFNNSILFVTFISLMYNRSFFKKIIFYILLLFVIYVIYISGERKGLICVFIIAFGALYANNANKGIKSFLYIGFLLLLSLVGFEIFMNYSVAGDRMNESLYQSDFQNNWFLKMMGDRGIHYYEGWHMFLENMITGIGINNFRWQNTFFEGLPFHTEYMVQLTECGIVGASIYLLFNYSMISRLKYVYKKKIDISDTLIMLTTYISILVINFVTWTFDNTNYFLFYGLLIGYCDLKRKQLYEKSSFS